MSRSGKRVSGIKTTDELAGRGSMALTVSDLQALRLMSQKHRDEPMKSSLKQVAEEIELQRTLLYRLIARANEQLGFPDLKWTDRTDGLYVPPEVHRLTRCLFADDEFLAGCTFPIVSAGSSALVLLTEFILQQELPTPRLSFSRSDDCIPALQEREIDLALVHDFEDAPTAVDESLERQVLVNWESRCVYPQKAALNQCRPVEWERNSFAWKLTQRAARATRSARAKSPIRLTGYSHGLEVLRRGHAISMVVPSLYLRADDRDRLNVDRTTIPIKGQLVAIFRRQDRMRLGPWLTDGWNEFAHSDVAASV